MKIYKPPRSLPSLFPARSLFLGGSIEMGGADDWQEQVTNQLSSTDLTIFNPRRDNWDSTWVQEITNPEFKAQVSWELEALERCGLILIHFVPGTKSPISLLELGLFGHASGVHVCCPKGFWRKGNVDIVCERYSIPIYEKLESAVEVIKKIYK